MKMHNDGPQSLGSKDGKSDTDRGFLTYRTRIPSLDGLRAVAITLVILGHLAGTRNFPLQQDYLVGFYADAGVRLFFVLSGFLITTLLLRERDSNGDVSLRNFYIRRACRILPAAYCYMLVVIAACYGTLPGKQIAIALLYLSSYSLGRPWVLGHLWSLSVEEQFYFLWPAALKSGKRFAKQLAIGVVILAPVARILLRWTGHIRWMGSVPVIGDSIAMGCLLAIGQSWMKRYQRFFAWRGFLLIWIFTWAIPLLNARSTSFSRIGGTVIYIGLAACMQNAMVACYRILNARISVWIGALSYSLYLWQQPFLNRASNAWYAAFPANLGLAIIAAMLSYYCIERPALRWRDRREADASAGHGLLDTSKESA
jgi:peptidoglycan/LPS O-acetylase OafA/YrhL